MLLEGGSLEEKCMTNVEKNKEIIYEKIKVILKHSGLPAESQYVTCTHGYSYSDTY